MKFKLFAIWWFSGSFFGIAHPLIELNYANKGYDNERKIPITTRNPLQNYSDKYGLGLSDVIVVIYTDVNGDGVKDYLISDDEQYQLIIDEPDYQHPLCWDVYLSDESGGYRYVCDSSGSGVSLLPSICYIGKIDELGGKRGILTDESHTPRRGEPQTRVIASTFENNEINEQILLKFSGTDTPPKSYQKYFWDKPTKVKVEVLKIADLVKSSSTFGKTKSKEQSNHDKDSLEPREQSPTSSKSYLLWLLAAGVLVIAVVAIKASRK